MKLEVRCCCVPNKLLGWIDLSPGMASIADKAQRIYYPDPENGPFGRIELPIAIVQHTDGRRYRAFKSNEYPLEVLLRIPGFTENTGE